MITLTRLSGSVFLLNADLIERVDSTPDTVISLVDGKKYIVAESMGQVLDAVVAYRGEIVALGSLLDAAHSAQQLAPAPRRESRGGPHLAAVAPHPAATGSSDSAGSAGSADHPEHPERAGHGAVTGGDA